MPERDRRLADALAVGQQALAVEVGQRAGHDELVLDALRLEAAAPEAAQLDRMVDELVVAVGLVAALARGRHRGRDLPVARQAAQLELVVPPPGPHEIAALLAHSTVRAFSDRTTYYAVC